VTRFERDTGVRRVGAGRFEVRFDRGWWISRGPNGGYVAAVVLRALAAEVDAAERVPRSFTVHFTAPPSEGMAEVEVTLERRGRSMTTATARLLQGDRLCALAIAAFSAPRRGPEFQEERFPRVAPPERAEPRPESPGGPSPIHRRYECLVALPERGDRAALPARTGGWIRLREPQPIDPFVVAAISDAWPPALMQHRWPEGAAPPAGFPTVDLSVHFRRPLPLPGLEPDAFLLAQFHTRVVHDGFLEEDGEIWTPDGTLVAHSRQLGALL
jgi:acyl-CoA thioesterase